MTTTATPTTPINPTSDLQQVPLTALSAPVTLLMKSEQSAENEWPLHLKARSGDVLNHWFWGPMVHDFAGMTHKDRIKVDYLHDPGQILGYVDDFDVTDYGLELGGKVISAAPGDRSSEVAHKAKAGVPYEASIEFSHVGLKAEWIPEGRSTEVNGQTYEGPLTVFREWSLIGVAICPNGYDANTATELHRDSGFFEFQLSKGDDMPNGKTTNKPDASAGDGQGKTTELQSTDGGQTPSKPATKPASKPDAGSANGDDSGDGSSTELSASDKPATGQDDGRTQLQAFVERFGSEAGTEYFLGQLSLEQALDKHNRKMITELKAKDDQIAELQEKLGQLSLGEDDPVSAGKTEPEGSAGKKSTGLVGAIRIAGRR